jgi:ubiquinone/menaquinone biosynthesis C-methylase UbiE
MRQEKYDDTNPVVAFVIRRFFERVSRMLAELAPLSLLDAGAGEGELARRGVLPPGVRMTPLDLSAEALAGQADAVRGSVAALPFRDRGFDAVVCLEVLEHLADPRPALAELLRVARKGVVVSVPYEPWFRIGNVLRGKHLARLGDHPEHVQHWNRRTFGALLASEARDVQIEEAFPWIVARCRL